MELLFKFLIGHAVADFVLQGDTMAQFKNRHHTSAEGLEDKSAFPGWYYWVKAHTLVHGGIVFFITGSWMFGLAEVILHWFIDYSKCEDWLNFHQDQALHLLCKIGYLFLL